MLLDWSNDLLKPRLTVALMDFNKLEWMRDLVPTVFKPNL